MYRSQFLVDTLHGMGFASSYKEVLRFEKNAADSVAPDMLADYIDVLDMALLFAGDNVDHIILRIDGKETFHGMGIITAITQGRKNDRIIPRRHITNLDFAVQSKIPAIEYCFAKHVRQTIVFNDLPALCLLVDHVKLGIVRITIINLYGRKSVTTNGKSSEGHSAKKYKK
ncbi:hypothetical protein F2P81_001340 [Scophthalmus maximus]|uniref:Uncharacterized protein n=1 Tax=Scophthalmus maximus TaxID=52904 RepID=A0A6A4TLH1_SCOMX|nr:hypothetical protein F2P81_001340 [Scophthalmus maximus]